MIPSSLKPNALIHASSPYLLQHAYNPVEWNEWAPEQLEQAATENKLLVISIGYAACHWCHVMEHESFEKVEVAEWMNNFYINIKVDREERPDIDAVYMNAAQLTTGRGGWPLNVIALPNGRPVFAGTYFPKDRWIKILEHFAGAWKKNPQELIEVAGKIEEGLNQMENEYLPQINNNINALDFHLTRTLAENIYSKLDLEKGGLDKAPKFPMPCIFDFLLHYNFYKKDERIKMAIHATLINMMEGGIYDQVGGGFARYSVDEYWFVPHFEKMMYDNAQLISLYSKAYAYTGVIDYIRISSENIQRINREMLNEHGLFYSSLDADSEGIEGKFYCFTQKEIQQIVTDHAEIFCDYFSIKEEGNWEHSNILYVGKTITEICENYDLTHKQAKRIIEVGKNQLLKAKESRIRPGLDDKCLTAWNALTITGMLQAYQFTENHFAFTLAQKAVDFLREKLLQKNGLYYRNFKNNKASIPGFLDDQIFMVQALIEMYKVSWEESYLLDAKRLMEKIIESYYDPSTNTFFYTGISQNQPVLRTKEMMDNVIPSSNSVASQMLYQLGHYFADDRWLEMSLMLCLIVQDPAKKHAPYYSNWGNTILSHTHAGIEVAIIGELELKDLLKFYKIPGLILMKKNTENSKIPLLQDKPHNGALAIYLCQNKTCGLPINSVEEALQKIRELLPINTEN